MCDGLFEIPGIIHKLSTSRRIMVIPQKEPMLAKGPPNYNIGPTEFSGLVFAPPAPGMAVASGEVSRHKANGRIRPGEML